MDKEIQVTYFASVERSNSGDIESSYHQLKNNDLIIAFQEAMPDLAMILDMNRQLVFANKNLVRYLDIEDGLMPLGERLGNLLSCIHSEEIPNGCGTTKACRFCGIVNAILECQETGKPIVKEARVTTVSETESHSYDLKVKASPLEYAGRKYTIICINDISEKKLNQVYKNGRYNEMYDHAATLNSMVNSINKELLDAEDKSKLESVEKVNQELIFDLYSQKLMTEAEEGKLNKTINVCNSLSILKSVEQHFLYNEVSKGKKLFLDPFTHAVRFKSDENLISRVLISLVTNGMEAVPQDGIVSIGARISDKEVKFWVKTPKGLTEEEKLQIFQRSFSTKGVGRGLGTYLTKLIVTKYLKGTVYFTTLIKENTFFVNIPINAE